VPRRDRTKHDLTCICPRKPLLAVFGVDASGQRYVHVLVRKQSRIYAEIMVTEGTSVTHITCRECARRHKVFFPPQGAPQLEVVSEDPSVQILND
jgi:hypothetical protein